MIKYYSTDTQQEIFLGRGVFLDWEQVDKYSTAEARHTWKKFDFPPCKLNNWTVDEIITQEIPTIRVLFLISGRFFETFEKEEEKPSLLHPSKYLSVAMKNNYDTYVY